MPQAHMEEDRFAPSAGPPDTEPVETVGSLLQGYFSPIGALGPAGHIGPREEVEKELDLIAAAIRAFYHKPPDMVMRECAAYTARLTELAVLIHRREAQHRQWTRIRTQQVQRFIDELDRQWKTASRLIEVSRQDIEVLRGQR